MSPEQPSSSEFSQSAANNMAAFERDYQADDTSLSKLVPIEVIRARQAIAAAVATAPSGSLEVNKVQPTVERATALKVKAITDATLSMLIVRKNHEADTIDIFADDEAIAGEILNQPAEVSPSDTQDNFGLSA